MIAKLEWLMTRETPEGYSSRSRFIYEVVLRTAGKEGWLARPDNAHRTLQALLLIQKTLGVEWMDILFWNDGIYLRLKLGRASTLMEVLDLLRRKTAGSDPSPWEDEPTWVRMLTPEKSEASEPLLWEKLDSLLGSIHRHSENPASMFFYHRGDGS
jgi:hypothetical protein